MRRFAFITGDSMNKNSYKTIRTQAKDEYIVKKSRFIGHIKPVTTQEEALAFIAEVSKKHWDATHNVYAYILRESGVKRYSDDGEPQGTAGIPVLDVLEKSGVTDCAVVVSAELCSVQAVLSELIRIPHRLRLRQAELSQGRCAADSRLQPTIIFTANLPRLSPKTEE